MIDEFLTTIVKDVRNFLKTNINFTFQTYLVRLEVGELPATAAGVNIYESAYDMLDGQKEDVIEIIVEYYENETEGDLTTSGNPTRIKERAKIFHNWLNARYSKGYGQDIADLCARFYITNIRATSPLRFYKSDKGHIVTETRFEIQKRNLLIDEI